MPGTGRAPAPGAPRPDAASPVPRQPRPKRRARRLIVTVVVALLLALVAWPVGLAVWANGRLHRADVLSGAASTPGITYLIAGSDERAAGEADFTAGARADTIMLLHVPDHGPVALISIPRDSYVEIPGHGKNKINASYSIGGPALLVSTVEKLSGMTVDHYVGVGFGGVKEVVDALGGVSLCYDATVNDTVSGFSWVAGCHDTDGSQALLFSRMRYADPKGDIGRGERQRTVISAVADKVASPGTITDPGRQVAVLRAGTDALTVDRSMSVVGLAHLALDFRAATGPGGITGTPPIKNPDYRPGKVGSTVQLDPTATAALFAQIRDGSHAPGVVGGLPG